MNMRLSEQDMQAIAAGEAPPPAPFLRPGENCWRVGRAQRLQYLVDGADYFRAFRETVARARHSVFILGWDLHSRTELLPDAGRRAYDHLPGGLGDFLAEMAARRHGLHIYVLGWDFAMVYALEREWMPLYRPEWHAHRRIRFALDNHHPPGASHHQKVVVVDDAVAFVGGLDLTIRRWDTQEHAPDDPLRRDPDGKPYPPFHDVQVMLDGEPARRLGEMARQRWALATGRPLRLALAEAGRYDPWPPNLAPDIQRLDVGIARTLPAYGSQTEVTEIRRLYLDAIAACRRHMYLENQYFSSSVIGDALAGRLSGPRPPEVVLVTRRDESGWLEESTMGVLRYRLHKRLRAADPEGRYHAYYPDLAALGEQCINVHSKVAVFDDQIAIIGSANLNNRSLGLDSECNLVISADGDPRVAASIDRLRNRLLAEHLGEPEDAVAAGLRREGGLADTIRSLGSPARRLAPLEPAVSDDLDALVPGEALLDPERPIRPDALVDSFVPRGSGRSVAGRITLGVSLLLLLAGMAAAWKFTSLGEYLDYPSLVALGRGLRDSAWAPLAVLGAFTLGTLAALPVTLLIIASALVFGPLMGSLYSLAGCLAGGAATYWLGRGLGRDTVRRLAGRRLNQLSRRLGEHGVLAMVALRMLPVAPYTIVNVVAGATHIRWKDFMLGTLLGMAPGIILTSVFVRQVLASARNPGPGSFLTLAAIIAAMLTFSWLVWRHFGNRPSKRASATLDGARA